jgi:hypothetical protein
MADTGDVLGADLVRQLRWVQWLAAANVLGTLLAVWLVCTR